MKRALAMALGAMLAAGAVPASAKSEVDFSGQYITYMYGVWNQEFTKKNSNLYDNDFFLADRLELDFGFQATEEISVYWRLRAPDSQRWGQYSASSSIESRYYYGELKQDWGTLSLGRLKEDYSDLGLASLGYAPGGPDVNATYMGVFDWDDAMSGIRYANRWDGGFQLAAAVYRLDTAQASINGDGDPDSSGNIMGLHDETKDLFIIEPAYFWDGGGASLGLHYLRDHVQENTNMPAYKEYAINPAFFQSFGDFAVHFEGKAGFGKAANEEDWTKEDKSSGYALYLDADYSYGPGNVTLAGWYASGPGDKNDDKAKGTLGMGDAFAPLIVAYGANGNGWWYGPGGGEPATIVQIANSRAASTVLSAPQQYDANHWALDLNGAHAFTDDLTLTYAVAYLNLLKVDPGAKKNIGWEADLGLQVQLLDNLQLGTTVGYLMAGDALKESPTADKPDDAYSWFTTLIFSF